MNVANARVDIFGGTPVVNEFTFQELLLTDGTLRFKQFDSYTEEWAEFVYKHRDRRILFILQKVENLTPFIVFCPERLCKQTGCTTDQIRTE